MSNLKEAMNDNSIEVVSIPTADLKEASYNPRTISDKKREQIKKSILKFGFTEPLIVNCHSKRMNILVGGHQRLRIAKELGIESIPCVYVNLTLKREKELNVRLNDGGDFDHGLLANFDPELLEDLGFEFLVDDVDLEVTDNEREDIEDTVPVSTIVNPSTKNVLY